MRTLFKINNPVINYVESLFENNIDINKQQKRNILKKAKIETIIKAKNTINEYFYTFVKNNESNIDLLKGNISILYCISKNDKDKWQSFVHLSTSLPYYDNVGRRIKLFILCDKTVIGMIQLSSPPSELKILNDYLKLNKENKFQKLNKIYNISTCVPIKEYSKFLTGKLLIHCLFSKEIINIIQNKYQEKPIGFVITSLWGKSSIYNRLPMLKYLGLSGGNSTIHIPLSEWKQIKKQYKEKFPNIKKSKKLAPIKSEILSKLKLQTVEYKNENFKKGIYYGEIQNIDSLYNMVSLWRERWLKNRIIYLKENNL